MSDDGTGFGWNGQVNPLSAADIAQLPNANMFGMENLSGAGQLAYVPGPQGMLQMPQHPLTLAGQPLQPVAPNILHRLLSSQVGAAAVQPGVAGVQHGGSGWATPDEPHVQPPSQNRQPAPRPAPRRKPKTAPKS